MAHESICFRVEWIVVTSLILHPSDAVIIISIRLTDPSIIIIFLTLGSKDPETWLILRPKFWKKETTVEFMEPRISRAIVIFIIIIIII